jgi:hypothetical protein
MAEIISVGYTLSFPDDIKNCIEAGLLAAERPIDLADFSISHVVTAGVLYGMKCKGGLNDVKAEQQDLKTWYRRRAGKVYIACVKAIYVSCRPNVIMAHITVFISKTGERMQTTHFKRLANFGKMGKPLPIESFNIEAIAYLHEKK